ncbi:hypothetical protein HK405_009105 [Cladochytrium tenue]|nr:hypothetical protein HK405_009105 [Cladochytrium tenue]
MKIEPAGTSTSQSEYAIAIHNATFKWESVKLAAGSEDPESKEGKDVKRPPKGSSGLFNVNEAESGSNESPKPEIAPLFKGLDLAIPRGKLTRSADQRMVPTHVSELGRDDDRITRRIRVSWLLQHLVEYRGFEGRRRRAARTVVGYSRVKTVRHRALLSVKVGFSRNSVAPAAADV